MRMIYNKMSSKSNFNGLMLKYYVAFLKIQFLSVHSNVIISELVASAVPSTPKS